MHAPVGCRTGGGDSDGDPDADGDGDGDADGDGDGDADADCPGGLTLCGTACVDVESDLEHCGSCDRRCGIDEVCSEGDGAELPESCPCPFGSYCDLALNTCVQGCLSDEDCAAGTICFTDARECRPGCRGDEGCSPGQICTDLECRSGCRGDERCGEGEICVELTCREGCRGDGDCAGGSICVDTRCVEGCRPGESSCSGAERCCAATLSCELCCLDSDCSTGDICEPEGAAGGLVCVDGCRADLESDRENCGECGRSCVEDSWTRCFGGECIGIRSYVSSNTPCAESCDFTWIETEFSCENLCGRSEGSFGAGTSGAIVEYQCSDLSLEYREVGCAESPPRDLVIGGLSCFILVNWCCCVQQNF